MVKIIWTEPALTDLGTIADYISLDNEFAAKSLIKNIFSTVNRLEIFPKSDHLLPELQHLQYREVMVKPCRIIYKYMNEKIFILHVMRSEQDLRQFMLNQQIR